MLFFSFQKMAKWSSQHNGKFPDPYSKIKLDEEKKVKKKKKKKDKDRESILNQIDPNTNKVNIFLRFIEVEKKQRISNFSGINVKHATNCDNG